MSGDTRSRYFGDDATAAGHDTGNNLAKGAAGGGMIGGTLGAIVGALTLTGAIGATVATGGAAAPLIAGPLAAALAGGGAGAAAGSVIGGIAGAGIPQTTRDRIEGGVAGGHIVVALNAKDEDVSQAGRILGDETSGGTTARPGSGNGDRDRLNVDAGGYGSNASTIPDAAGAGQANRSTVAGVSPAAGDAAGLGRSGSFGSETDELERSR